MSAYSPFPVRCVITAPQTTSGTHSNASFGPGVWAMRNSLDTTCLARSA